MKEGWTYKKLPEISENLDSIRKPVTKKNRTSGIYPYYGASGIVDYVDDYLFDEDLLCISEDGANLLMRTYPIAFPISGKVWVNNHAHVLRFKSMTTQKYVEYFFAGKKIDEYITGAAQPKLTQKALNNITIHMPLSVEEQQAIVSRLDSAFAHIDALKANAEKQLEEARKLFQAELTETMKPKEGWEEKRMKDVYDVRDGTHDSPKYHETGYPLVTSKNLRGGILDMSNVSLISEVDYRAINNRSKVDVGDVLFAMIGTIGNPVYVQVEPHYAIKNMALFKVPSNQSGEFLKYYLLNEDVLLKMQTESKGTTQKFVSLGYLRNFLITIPPLSTQHQIVSRLDALSANVKRLEELQQKTLKECDALKQAMLREVFE